MKIALLLSGGVDSSTALRRLIDAGFTDITAYYLKIWLEDEVSYLGDCPWEEDLSFATAVCQQAGIELRIVSLQLEYFDRVVSYALEELKEGRTPSPDIFCNQRVKFGAFYEHVSEQYDWVATGHYALTQAARGMPSMDAPWTRPFRTPRHDPWAGLEAGARLYRAPDPVKDQTYFLSHLNQDQISRLVFPIGDLPKAEVRQLAESYDLANKARKDSQGICFLGKIPYNEFVGHYLGKRPGHLVDASSGEILGEHAGFWYHTIGQRTGLGLGNGPWYVVAKDTALNVVYVQHGSRSPQALSRHLELAGLTFISGLWPDQGRLDWWNGLEAWGQTPKAEPGMSGGSGAEANALRAGSEPDVARRAGEQEQRDYRGFQLKLRHGPVLVPCRASWVPGHAPSDPVEPWERRLSIEMEKGDGGIAAGQFAVLYVGDECLGSGKIQELDAESLAVFAKRYQDRLEMDRQAREVESARKAAKKKLRASHYKKEQS